MYRTRICCQVSVIAYFDNSSRAGSPSLLYDTKEEMLAFREERPNNSVKMAIFAKRVSEWTMNKTFIVITITTSSR